MALFALDGVQPVLPEEESFWIADDANVIGHVLLEKGVSVWFGATIRGDNEVIKIGAGSNVQENSVLHTDIGYPLKIGINCTIGHKAMLHGCNIGHNSLIGMGATILNGAIIGENCLIGAGALIPEGKEIQAGSLVMGVPGRIVKKLDDQAIKGIKNSALWYQQNMLRFKTRLIKL
jgi:carbonic anhydrase/acetyltransferase-like protein (isoleucine patch superfamily)